jgi:hypothetical protein
VAWVRERTIPTERPPLVGEASANLCGSVSAIYGQRVVIFITKNVLFFFKEKSLIFLIASFPLRLCFRIRTLLFFLFDLCPSAAVDSNSRAKSGFFQRNKKEWLTTAQLGYTQINECVIVLDRLCGLVVRVPFLATDPGVSGSIPGTTRFSEK